MTVPARGWAAAGPPQPRRPVDNCVRASSVRP